MYIYFIHMPCVSMRLLKTQLYKKKRTQKRRRSTRRWGGGWNGNGSAAWSYVEWNRSLVWFTGFGFKKKKKRKKKKKWKRKKNENGTVFSVFLVTLQLNGLSVLQIRSFKCFKNRRQRWRFGPSDWLRRKPGQVFIINSFMISTSWTRGNAQKCRQSDGEDWKKQVGGGGGGD